MAEQLIPLHSSLRQATASQIIDEALRLRQQHGLLPLAVMVLDAGGNPVCFKREDGCGVMRHDIALGKAYAALGMGMATRQIRDRLADRPRFQAALAATSQGRFIPTLGGMLPLHKSGRMRLVGVTTAKRSAMAPDIPTEAESAGLSAPFEAMLWNVVALPHKTPAAVAKLLADASQRAMTSTDMVARLAEQGMFADLHIGDVAASADVKAEAAKWTPVVNKLGAAIKQ